MRLLEFQRAARRMLALLMAALLALAVSAPAPARAEGSGMIRVRLTRLGTPSAITLEVDCGYVLSGDARINLPAGSRVSLRAENGGITADVGGARLYLGAQAQLLRCGSDGLRFISPGLANRFCGDLYLSASRRNAIGDAANLYRGLSLRRGGL